MQTEVDGQPVTVRARHVTTTGFQAALVEEAPPRPSGHGVETVGYLAITAPTRSGTVNLGDASQPYLLQQSALDERWTPVVSSALRLEAAQTQAAALDHQDETVAVLALGPHLFAQDISAKDADPVALRRQPPEDPAPVEWGAVDGVAQAWVTVPLAKTYVKPVVVARVARSPDPAPGDVRIRNVTPTALELGFQAWNERGRPPRGARIFYLVAEDGPFTLAGLQGEARQVTASPGAPAGLEPQFTQPFDAAPAVFTAVMMWNDPDTASTDTLTATGLAADAQPTETLGWIALAPGVGWTGDQRQVQVTAGAPPVPLATAFNRRFPVVLQALCPPWETATATAVPPPLAPTAVGVSSQQEQLAATEPDQAAECQSIFTAD